MDLYTEDESGDLGCKESTVSKAVQDRILFGSTDTEKIENMARTVGNLCDLLADKGILLNSELHIVCGASGSGLVYGN